MPIVAPEELMGAEMIKASHVGTLALGFGVLGGCGEGDGVVAGVGTTESQLVQTTEDEHDDSEMHRVVSEEEARMHDALIIVGKTGWSLEEVFEHFEKSNVVETVAVAIDERTPGVLVGSKVGSPGEPPTIWLKGAMSSEARAIIEDADTPIQVVDLQPRSHAENDDRLQRVAASLGAMGLESFKLGSDITRRGRLDLVIQGDPETSDRVMAGLDPTDTQEGIDISVQAERVGHDDTIFGGMSVYNSSTSVGCTSGFTVRHIYGSTAIGNVTAGHCAGMDKIVHPGVGLHSYPYVNPPQHLGPYGDVELHNNSNVSSVPDFYVYSSVRSVTSIESAPSIGFSIDEWLCMYSQMQDDDDCAQVSDQSVCYDTTRCKLVEVDEDAQVGGDSGAPWYNLFRAYGIHVASSNVSGTDPNGWAVLSVADYFPEAIGAVVLLD
jgi:hypothetical protein